MPLYGKKEATSVQCTQESDESFQQEEESITETHLDQVVIRDVV
ncbi:hypothetical protein AB837_00490 [bacterium AB1]|nr:hypothetical protein AB837_00490 [bacterium AB1]